MRLKCKTVLEGPGPSESIVAIDLQDGGEEEVIISRGSINNETIEVGWVERRENFVLVELPNESASGSWRLWVNHSDLS